ncbi:NAD(P)-dependent dehydrogenase (short-subunit alcohol dehydrogenase family) [Novosphingobium chloroacetimidivorans]|uniref:NAD(P)-dependent dehydrogenase (Short-subunit alcohol dehydrogenase family) n=1 Tax=Novosphingobium chloroacetimidivorans TaxID=1428314 RepID=A0A7W7NVB7_9SPHN|nr:glucose 1-dehydrogenase [Novosphingobium chloroacetimidivorans]MBB4858398.1 NAD(P)-dependent dehydrogenase (short-subunit alcohol dehydrogenase family) [Novosphingobium chloroacetimidivorans]
MTGRLEGKIALVTGAGGLRGLGAATAQRFAQEGAFVYVTDLDRAGAGEVAAAIEQAGGQAQALAQDVTSESSWDEIFATIERGHGRLDVLVNNAGIAILKPLPELTAADWERQNKVNLDSVFFGTQRAVALMRNVGQGGSIVNLSSIAGIVGVTMCGAYAAAKGGVRLFSKVVAMECAADNIRCNSVHPGMIETAMQDVARRDNPEGFKQIVSAIPMQRMGSPLDIANMNLFLASDESGYITGCEFVVDGGSTAM